MSSLIVVFCRSFLPISRMFASFFSVLSFSNVLLFHIHKQYYFYLFPPYHHHRHILISILIILIISFSSVAAWPRSRPAGQLMLLVEIIQK